MILSNGAEIKFDWAAISTKEWRALFDKDIDEEANDIIVGKLVGMTADELTELNPVDNRMIVMEMFKEFKAAIDTSSSKNSQGASTSE